MLRVIEVPKQGHAFLNPDPNALAPSDDVLRWIDVEDPTRELLEQMKGPFGLHPLAIEDCLTQDQRPKLEEYTGHIFVVVHELSLSGEELSGREIHAFLGANFVITVRDGRCKCIDEVVQRVIGATDFFERGVSFIYYLITDFVASHNVTALDELEERIDAVEERVLEYSDESTLAKVFDLKHALGNARRVLAPQRDLIAALSRVESRWIGERTAFYFRDVYDKLARAAETLEASRELLGNVVDAHFSVIAQRTNEVVKRLTILSVVFMPLTFMTGFFGQNFEFLPYHSRDFMWGAFALCLFIPPVMLYWFRRQHWI